MIIIIILNGWEGISVMQYGEFGADIIVEDWIILVNYLTAIYTLHGLKFNFLSHAKTLRSLR
jgi:hypothetical protein